jgi:hypothetical protein
MMVLQVEGVHKRWSSAMYRDPTGRVMVIFVKSSCDNGAVAVASGVNTVNKMQRGRIRVEVHCEGRPIMEVMFTAHPRHSQVMEIGSSERRALQQW